MLIAAGYRRWTLSFDYGDIGSDPGPAVTGAREVANPRLRLRGSRAESRSTAGRVYTYDTFPGGSRRAHTLRRTVVSRSASRRPLARSKRAAAVPPGAPGARRRHLGEPRGLGRAIPGESRRGREDPRAQPILDAGEDQFPH